MLVSLSHHNKIPQAEWLKKQVTFSQVWEAESLRPQFSDCVQFLVRAVFLESELRSFSKVILLDPALLILCHLILFASVRTLRAGSVYVRQRVIYVPELSEFLSWYSVACSLELVNCFFPDFNTTSILGLWLMLGNWNQRKLNHEKGGTTAHASVSLLSVLCHWCVYLSVPVSTVVVVVICFTFLQSWGIEPRDLCMLGKCSTLSYIPWSFLFWHRV